jgi:hypothetical protein
VVSLAREEKERGCCCNGRRPIQEADAEETQRNSPRRRKSAVGQERENQMKTLFAILLTASAAFAQATVKYEQIAPNCNGVSFLDQFSSGCFSPRIKVTAHPSTAEVAGVFILVTYKSVMFGSRQAQPHFTMARDEAGDFIAIFPSGDMSDIVISAVGVASTDLIVASPVIP